MEISKLTGTKRELFATGYLRSLALDELNINVDLKENEEVLMSVDKEFIYTWFRNNGYSIPVPLQVLESISFTPSGNNNFG